MGADRAVSDRTIFVLFLIGVLIWGNFLYWFLDRFGVFKKKKKP
jgi:hypothetical protein